MVRLDVPFRVAISQPQLNTDGPLTDTAQWSNTGVTGTPNRTLTGRHQSRPKDKTRRVVRLDVPFRVAISQPQLNTDGPLTDPCSVVKHRSHWDTSQDRRKSIGGHGGCPAPCPRDRKKIVSK